VDRKGIFTSTTTNLVLAVATYLYYGLNAIGAAVAARNTARFSALVFAAAFIARNARTEDLRAAYRTLSFGFLAAHYVHFAAVIAFTWMTSANGLETSIKLLPVWLIGFSIVTVAAISTDRWKRTNTVFTYLVWGSFTIALASNLGRRLFPELPLVVVLVTAMAVHLYQIFARPRSLTAQA
jgi:hypothetical protein